ncbi:chitin elicitor-binding protein-like [Iris pallida]|uniref:Chitin elicitor-binding protein-like n=1 Tax=Iris pallida TaxID=29817 RepID=A0AAX6IAU4_IRIPA|nr:chitin elicitor-binding protein-like [Iris pallida]
MAHIVAAGSSLEKIASEFGTEKDVLMKLNGITDPKSLQAGQVLDVPLHACSSSISNNSLDRGLLLPNGSYALTAANCIQCSCSSSSKYQLSCNPIQSLNSTVCPVTKCGDLYIGNSTTSGCDQTTCAYEGYTNSTGLKILSGLTTQSTCNVGSPQAQPPASSQPEGNSSPNSAGRLGLHRYWIQLIVLFQMALFFLRF